MVDQYWAWLSLTALTIVTVGSLTPLEQLPKIPSSDKLQHLIAYAGIIFPVALRWPKFFWLWVVLLLAWSGAIELIQPMVNRYGDWSDWFANASGIALGVMAGLILSRWKSTTSE